MICQHTELHPHSKEHAGNYWERSSPGVQMDGELELVGQEWRWKSLWLGNPHYVVQRVANRVCYPTYTSRAYQRISSPLCNGGVTAQRRPKSMDCWCATQCPHIQAGWGSPIDPSSRCGARNCWLQSTLGAWGLQSMSSTNPHSSTLLSCSSQIYKEISTRFWLNFTQNIMSYPLSHLIYLV